MDYSCEPERSPLLVVRSKEPFNAEPTPAALVEYPLTPEDLIYCRNHGPVREFDPDTYSMTFRVTGKEVKLSLNDLKSLFPKVETVALLQVRWYSQSIAQDLILLVRGNSAQGDGCHQTRSRGTLG